MSGRLTIALDAMGGDQAPRMVLRGANMARKRFPNVDFVLFGRESEVGPMLDRMKRLKQVTTLVHCEDVVSDAEKPSVALRSARDSSMRRAIEAVRDGRANGCVSAGNTGALMAMAKMLLKTLPGIDRPAIASFFPTLRGESVMLDLGANVHCDAQNLVDFAVMGNAFSRTVLGTLEPTTGLLNVGSEERKGHEALWNARAQLNEVEMPGRFHGFIEGDDIANGTVDVIVTDGFTGNVALKTAEGTAKLVSTYLRRTFKSSIFAQLGYLLARRAIEKMRKRTDPRRYNGAIFLGLNGITVKSHGGTDAVGFANAIGVAVDMARHGFLDRIRTDLERINRHPPKARAAAV
ncbi:phosphate acyltransferase PlsX [Ferruginivarius sediminum]|uniref:Phosphate acyltransferase n=1 Tax=Ferruginivarius sediminum TaxID=2661937 RepID=A0A369TGQ3_9PROT|nr:phosphate acyltransferase PlsX [Ferruginivarius sediminum]RDD63794.1 phosphate acyltransferase PlsX [Ferruginivarius sediminum]